MTSDWLFLSFFFYKPDLETELLLSDFLKILPDLGKQMNVVVFSNPSIDWYLRSRIGTGTADLRLIHKNISQFDIEGYLDRYREDYKNNLPRYWLFLNLDNEKFPLFMSITPQLSKHEFKEDTEGDLFIFQGENLDDLLYDHLGNFTRLTSPKETEITIYFPLDDFSSNLSLLLNLPIEVEGSSKEDTIIRSYYTLLRSREEQGKSYLIDTILSNFYYLERKKDYLEILHKTLEILIISYASSENFRDSIHTDDMERYRVNLDFYQDVLKSDCDPVPIEVKSFEDLDRVIKGKMMKFLSPELLAQSEFFYPFHFFPAMGNAAVLVRTFADKEFTVDESFQ